MNADDVRARNESAWLLPNDGRRTNHRLRDDEPADPVAAGRRVEQARREHAKLLERGTR